MNKYLIRALKGAERRYSTMIGGHTSKILKRVVDPDLASDILYQLLSDDKPCMIARFGSTEMYNIVNYLGVKNGEKNVVKYVTGQISEWWWDKDYMTYIQNNSGFFPVNEENLTRFCEMMIDDIQHIDVLGSWLDNERWFENELKDKKLIFLPYLEPYFSKNPWSRVLEGKKILVVHPFANLFVQQYKQNRTKLFSNKSVLPEFEIIPLEAVQSLGGDSSFETWFDALQWMKDEIDKINYDICILGCGAYGMPLAAHIKRNGKKSFHLGGATQLLFGVKGNRWENPDYAVERWGIPYGFYTQMFNQYWVKPGNIGCPKNANEVEGATYW